MTFLRRKRKDGNGANHKQLQEQIIGVLRTIYDPEIPINIYELGLIYKVEVNQEQDVSIEMTLTTPACPVAQTFPTTVEQKVKELDWATNVKVDLVWDPPWTQERMTEAARLELGLM